MTRVPDRTCKLCGTSIEYGTKDTFMRYGIEWHIACGIPPQTVELLETAQRMKDRYAKHLEAMGDH